MARRCEVAFDEVQQGLISNAEVAEDRRNM
jgi:hypothetical protein